MIPEIKKSKKLSRFLEAKGLHDKFDIEVKRGNPDSYSKKKFDSITGSFKFMDAEDGGLYWQTINKQFEWYKLEKNGWASDNIKKTN